MTYRIFNSIYKKQENTFKHSYDINDDKLMKRVKPIFNKNVGNFKDIFKTVKEIK